LTVVLDSNVAVALALDTERAPTIEEFLRVWEEAKEALHAPSLFRFEVANA
jgi:predicted nucleic acid-binding protein